MLLIGILYVVAQVMVGRAVALPEMGDCIIRGF